ncbi:hypothetical protein [uncultured Roseobacter sp.]|uniref:hypothetical protein n=1 Tax=uncultured Roseobacter sp. TaxID=114847 RepID=UPI00260DE810|nr:hypothetical protein [uncultured Roseobacter sp.]
MTRRLAVCVVERNLFVAADIAEMLRMALPEADLAVFHELGAARTASVAPPDVLMIAANAQGTFDMSPEDAAWISSSEVIAFDAADRSAFPGWLHLSKPFAEEDLTEAVLGLIAGRSEERMG